MEQKIHPTCRFSVNPDALPGFGSLLQRGFFLPCPQPMPLATLLKRHFLDSSSLLQMVETVFVNGLAQDDLNVPVQAGDTVALSAAMPGLAGAIFRKGSIHRHLRSRPRPQGPAAMASRSVLASGHGDHEWLVVKLFNRIGEMQAPLLLPQGLLIPGPTLARFVTCRQSWLVRVAKEIRFDRQPLSVAAVIESSSGHPLIVVSIHAATAGSD